MGNLCCTKIGESSPTKYNQNRNFSMISMVQSSLPKNLSEFDSVYSLAKEKLGFGSYGDVKMSYDKQFSTVKAVKIINKDHLRTSNIENSWFYENIEIVSRLEHPLIIRFHEFFEDRDFFYLIMDYHKDGDLLKCLKSKFKLSEPKIAIIIKQLLIAVAYMHSKKIAHRDLKPENILINKSSDLSIKLIDFDTSASFEDKKLTGTLGTFHYMAPETINKSYDEKCDLWSVGIIMLILLTKKSDLPGLTHNQNPKRLQTYKIDFSKPFWKKVSEPAKDLIKRLLEKDPKKRISAVQAIQHHWFKPNSDEDYYAVYDFLLKIKNIHKKPLIKAAKKILIYLKDNIEDFRMPEKAFVYLDTDCDGFLTKSDFFSFFSRKHNEIDSENFAETLLQNINPENDEFVRYSEFLEASIDETIMTEPKTLRFFYKILYEGGICTDKSKMSKELRDGIGLKRKELQIWIEYFEQSNVDHLDFNVFSNLVIEGITN